MCKPAHTPAVKTVATSCRTFVDQLEVLQSISQWVSIGKTRLPLLIIKSGSLTADKQLSAHLTISQQPVNLDFVIKLGVHFTVHAANYICVKAAFI